MYVLRARKKNMRRTGRTRGGTGCVCKCVMKTMREASLSVARVKLPTIEQNKKEINREKSDERMEMYGICGVAMWEGVNPTNRGEGKLESDSEVKT